MPNKRSTINQQLSKEHLSDDFLFLIACCQTEPNKEDINFIHSYLNAERLDMNALITLAKQHGILPLIYKTIKELSQADSSFLNPERLTLNTESQSGSSLSSLNAER